MFERQLSLVKLLFHIVFCCCYHVYGELKIIKRHNTQINKLRNHSFVSSCAYWFPFQFLFPLILCLRHRRSHDGRNMPSVRLSSVCPSVVRQHLFRMMRYFCTLWRDFNETCRTYSSCERELLKRFSRSEIKGQGHDQTECYNGRGMRFDGLYIEAHLRVLISCGGSGAVLSAREMFASPLPQTGTCTAEPPCYRRRRRLLRL